MHVTQAHHASIAALCTLGLVLLGVTGCRGLNPQRTSALALPPLPTAEVPRAVASPQLGTKLDDPVWRGAFHVPLLAASLPAEADTDTAIGPAPKTEVRLLWDPEFLYVRFVSFDDEPFSPHGQQRDAPHYQGDVVEVFVDGVGDSRQWYELQVNPDGGVLDLNTVLSAPPVSDARGLLTVESNREYWSNLAYDMPGLRIATRREADAWIADLAIPAAELLRRRQANHLSAGTSLRLNLIRYDRPRAGGPDDSHRALHMACWSPVVLGRPHRSPQRMGVIHLVPSTP